MPITEREIRELRERVAALERENAAMLATLAVYREIVAAVANADVMCAQCDMRSQHIRHPADCPVARARALLDASQMPGTTGATAGEEGEI